MGWKWRTKVNAEGKGIWFFRGQMPVRNQETGALEYIRVERSSGTSNRAKAEQKARLVEQEFHRLAGDTSKTTEVMTFAEAAIVYMRSGGERKHLPPLLKELGEKPLTAIDQTLVTTTAAKLYPHHKPSSVNRLVYTPIIAILTLLSKDKKCPPPILTRPKGHADVEPLEVPPEEWYDAILPRLKPSKRALVIFLALHGRRIAEAIERRPADLDDERWVLSIPDTKTNVPIEVPLAEPVIQALEEYDWRSQEWIFGTRHRSNIHRDIQKAAEEAGLPMYGSHALGRHSFATRLLKAGRSLEFVRKAGHWKTIKMVSERYGHLEHDEVHDEVREMGADWGARRRAAEKAAEMAEDKSGKVVNMRGRKRRGAI